MPNNNDTYYLNAYEYKQTRCHVCGLKFADTDRTGMNSHYFRIHTRAHHPDAINRTTNRKKWGYP